MLPRRLWLVTSLRLVTYELQNPKNHTNLKRFEKSANSKVKIQMVSPFLGCKRNNPGPAAIRSDSKSLKFILQKRPPTPPHKSSQVDLLFFTFPTKYDGVFTTWFNCYFLSCITQWMFCCIYSAPKLVH